MGSTARGETSLVGSNRQPKKSAAREKPSVSRLVSELRLNDTKIVEEMLDWDSQPTPTESCEECKDTVKM